MLLLTLSTLAVVSCLPVQNAGPGSLRNPPFLAGQTQQAVQDYMQIVNNGTATIRQQKLAINSWADKYNMTSQWNSFNSNQTALQQQLNQNVTNTINGLPAANTQYQQILSNDDQTYGQQQQAIHDFVQRTGVPADVLMYIPKALAKNATGGGAMPMMMGGGGPGPVRLQQGNQQQQNQIYSNQNQQQNQQRPQQG